MNRSRWTLVLLLFVLAAGIASRVAGLAAKSTITHDEAISYICVTGHLGEYHRTLDAGASPYGEWVPASRWKRFWTLEAPFCFDRISAGLARYDVHPPLYFWLLHLWALVVGIHAWSGPLLNLLIDLTTALLLYRLARHVFAERFAASYPFWRSP